MNTMQSGPDTMKMNESKLHILRRHSKDQSGQSLILALIVMSCLAFIAGIMIALVGRNITRSGHNEQVLTSEYFSEAGIRYADDQLTYSQDGADWRPVPSYPKVVQAISNNATSTISGLTAGTEKPGSDDPDYKWLIQGFSRFNTGNGRFLLRVSYEPTPGDSMSKYIKIESIGRVGTVDSYDPTTRSIHQSSQQFATKVAYKPIGITDYARFVTNRENRPDENILGTPGFVTNYGTGDTSAKTASMGAPIRVNGNLTWYGTNYVWLKTLANSDRDDTVEVAGDINYAVLPYDPTKNTYSSTGLNVPSNGQPWTYINGNKAFDSHIQALPSSGSGPAVNCFVTDPDDTDPNVIKDTTTIGRYRDGNPSNDYFNHPRGITRLDPPLIDGVRAAGGYSRYRDLTRNSGTWQQNTSNNWYNTGYYGHGAGLYINNPDDVQQETATNSLRGNWTQPGTQYWNGPYYTPPGVSIVLSAMSIDGYKDPVTGKTVPEMVLTRDINSSQQWYDLSGNATSDTRIVMPYPENGVIFAEGNIRIKGTLPAGKQLTVVSGGTIYIEGSILKCPFDSSGNVLDYQHKTDSGLEPTAVERRDSSIALLANDYICVNTTQFFAPTRDSLMASTDGDYFDISPNKSFWLNWSFGASPSTYSDANKANGGSNVPVNLLVRHAKDPSAGTCAINMLFNYSASVSNLVDCFYKFDPSHSGSGQTYYPEQYGAPTWEYSKFQISAGDSGLSSDGTIDTNNTTPHLYTYPGVFNTFGFQLDQTGSATLASQGLQDYYLSRAAVVPCDIRIEALLYAQNKSFFVIPGEWFNPDPSDVKSTTPRPSSIDPEWPYYGEPLDVRIVVYGAVSENTPAPIGDTSAWMAKWGWIPPFHGSSTTVKTVNYRTPLDPTDAVNYPKATNRGLTGTDPQIPQQGLTFIYDSELSCPLKTSSDPTSRIRHDDYYRTLPLMPKLPVSTQLVYFGTPT